MEDLAEVLRRDDKHADALFYQGLTYLDYLGDYDKAIQNYSLLIKLQPQNAGAHNNLGIAYERRGRRQDLQQAQKEFTAAIRYDPKTAKHLTNRSRVRTALGDYTGAQADKEEAERLTRN